MESIVRMESNIWACIFRAVEERGGDQNDNPLYCNDEKFENA